jgi:hypothetical protein
VPECILLCRRHHLRLHNDRWEITRTGGSYSLVSPDTTDGARPPVPVKSKSAALRDLHGTSGGPPV